MHRIPGFSSDKCAQRNHLAARRDGVNAVPMRFLKSGDVQKFLAQSPHNRGGVGRLPASDAEALSIINAQRGEGKEPLTAEQVYIHYVEAANSNFIGDRYMFLAESTLRNIASDAQAGFAFMNSHRTGGLSHPSELPFGRTFCGRFENYTDEESGETRQRSVVGFYMVAGVKPNGDGGPSTDDLHKMIDAHTVFDVSVGLWGGTAICDVCGEDLNAYDRDEGWLCPHMPGSTYKMTAEQMEAQKARGVTDGAASCSLTDAHCGEVSAVYDGAVPGAGFNKALAFAKEGGLPDDVLEQLQKAYESLVGASHSQPFKPAKNHSKSPEGKGSPEGSLAHGNPVKGAVMNEKFAAALASALAAVGLNFGTDKTEDGKDAQLGATLGTLQSGTLTSGGVLQPAPAVGLAPVAVPPATLLSREREIEPAKLSAEDEARLANQQEAFTKQAEELAKMREDLDAANQRAAEQAAEARFAKNEAYIDEKKRSFFLTPTAADKMRELAKENPDAFEAIKPSIEANAPVVGLAGTGTEGTAANANTALSGQAEGNQLESLAKEYQTQHKVSYGEAFSAVCGLHPEVAAAYRAAQPGA